MSSTELDKLKRKRTTLKGMCTKIMNSVNSKLDQNVEINLQEIESLTEKLQIKEKEILEVEAQMEDLIENLEELETEIESRQDYRDQIIDIKINIAKRIEETKSQNSSQTVEQRNDRNNQNTSLNTVPKPAIKLPKIIIPLYDGSPEHWTEFWSQYEISIHENTSLSKVQKFVYLRSYLKAAALTAIQGFALSEQNYDSAIQILKSRFGNKEIIIRYKIEALLNLSSVRTANQIKELRALHDALDINIKSLQNLGVDLKSYGNLLFPIITKLIPTSIMIEYNKMKSENDEWDVLDLMKHLKLEVQTREKTFLFSKREPETHGNMYKNSNVKFENRSTGNNDGPYRKSNSGYKGSNTSQKVSAFKIAINKCVFCADTANDHESKNCKMKLEDKKLSLRKQGICYLCFKKGKHIAKFCSSRIKCEKCSGRHNTLICYRLDSDPRMNESNDNQGGNSETMLNHSESDNSVLTYKCSVQNPFKCNEIYLQTCIATICNKSNLNSLKCVILYDNASQRNFICSKLAQELNLPIIKKEKIIIYPFSFDKPQEKEYSVVSFELSNIQNPNKKCLIEALVVDQISYTKLKIASDDLIKRMISNKQIEKYSFPDMKSDFPQVLLGATLYWRMQNYKQKINNSLYAVNTLLGWTISGSNSDSNLRQSDASVLKVECLVPNLLQGENCFSDGNETHFDSSNIDFQKLWSLDCLGICDDSLISSRDQEIINTFENQLEFREGRYFTHLLWNDECSDKLSNNFENAKRQFDRLRKRLEKNNWVSQEYKQIIKEQMDLGIVEKCDRTESEYFAPHREVVRKNKQTSKVRIVFNCSSRSNGYKSLNDCLVKGPCLTPNILDIINRFRMFKVAFCADIEKAFLMIGIEESDRNYLKFLWFDDNTDDYKIMRMTRVTFGCTSSPFLLTATIKKHIKCYREKFPESYEMLNSALFVDDLVYGSNTIEKARELTLDATNILKEAGMKLRKFSTNSVELEDIWNKNDCFSEINTDRIINILGIVWDKGNDTLRLELKSILENLDVSLCTKRYVLHTAAKFFDPIGIISPFLIRVKCLLQRIWERGIDWDAELPADLRKDWIKWCNEIEDLLELRIDRCHFSRVDLESSRVELHIFSDASPLAYGCVAYFKVISQDGDCFVSMIMSKAKVAPLKKLTLPRLELMGAVLAARIGKYICDIFKEIRIQKFFWSDSSIVLHWLKGSAKEWKPFVKNRVMEIQSMSQPENWSYCCTKENPGDLVTRGVTANQLINNKMWFRGPNWLSQAKGRCGEVADDVEMRHVIEEKRKTPERVIQFSCPIKMTEPILNLENYSNIMRVFRITAWIKRFLNNTNPKNDKKRGPLSAEEIETAQKIWIKLTQELSFPNELNCLKNEQSIPKSSALVEFHPFLDSDRIMRIGGRLHKSKFSFNEKHPILLPTKGKFIELLIRHAHEKVFHFGVNDTLVQLREEFWVIKGRQAVKSVLKGCTICRRFNAKSGNQIMAPLPDDRIDEEQKPFSIIGLDFAGPLYVRNNENKYYILLCTCAITRAVHIELVENLSTETFLLAFRRLVARRGLCHTIYSDNAKTFHRAEHELRVIWEIISHPDVKDYYSTKKIKWKFIVEMSPWWGGFYERMVRSVKTALRKVVGKTTLSVTQLQTILTEIEASINSRPLTYVFAESGEPTPLTPAHFLVGQRLTALPIVYIKRTNFPNTSDAYVKRYNLKEKILHQFWKRWKTEYIFQLRSAITNRNARVFQFAPNDIVLINDDKMPRHLWKLGRITEVFTGRDGRIRSCKLKTAEGYLKRSIQLLYPLELSLMKN